MLYDTSSLMKCQVKKYSGLNFARKIRYVAPDVSSKIWFCGTSIGLTYDGLIASANFCKNRFCPTCQWRRSVKLFRQNYECFEWIKESLSARRAWIEIMSLNTQQRHLAGRSPQGERG